MGKPGYSAIFQMNSIKYWINDWLAQRCELNEVLVDLSDRYQTMGKPASELSREVIITNELGLHARSAAKIAALAQKGKSKIWIIKDKEKVDAASIIDILTLACTKGTKINLTIDDRSDVKILNAIAKLVEKGFGE